MADVIGVALSRGRFMQLTFINGDEKAGNVSPVQDEYGSYTGLYTLTTGGGEYVVNPAHVIHVKSMNAK